MLALDFSRMLALKHLIDGATQPLSKKQSLEVRRSSHELGHSTQLDKLELFDLLTDLAVVLSTMLVAGVGIKPWPAGLNFSQKIKSNLTCLSTRLDSLYLEVDITGPAPVADSSVHLTYLEP